MSRGLVARLRSRLRGFSGWRGWLVVAGCGVVGGCGPGTVGNHEGSGLDASGSVEDGSAGGGNTGAGGESSSAESTGASTGTGGNDTGHTGFIGASDAGPSPPQCSLFEQDCPEGEKCNIYASGGGNYWNGTKCVPVVPDPDDIGEPCTVEDNGFSGLDSCVLGAVCWDVDPSTNEGTCVAFCSGNPANPTCPDPSLTCHGRDFSVCLPNCCPLEQTCGDGRGCYPVGRHFFCAPDAGGESGAFGDPCEYLNVCDPGLFCANAETVAQCKSPLGCCTEFCDVTDPNADANCTGAAEGQRCVPWYEEGKAPLGFEHIGACILPS